MRTLVEAGDLLSLPGLVAFRMAVLMEFSRVGVKSSPAWHVTLNVFRALAPGVVTLACARERRSDAGRKGEEPTAGVGQRRRPSQAAARGRSGLMEQRCRRGIA